MNDTTTGTVCPFALLNKWLTGVSQSAAECQAETGYSLSFITPLVLGKAAGSLILSAKCNQALHGRH